MSNGTTNELPATLTVRELRKRLKKMPQDAPISLYLYRPNKGHNKIIAFDPAYVINSPTTSHEDVLLWAYATEVRPGSLE